MPSLTWSLIEGVVPGHLLEKPQKVLTSEECRFSLEDRLRSPNSSRLGVCVRVCVCAQMTTDQSCLVASGIFSESAPQGSPGCGEKRPHFKTRTFEQGSDKHKNTE